MAIPRRALSRKATEPPTDDLVAFYRRAVLELMERARQRLISDGRVLSAEARRARLLLREAAAILDELEGKRSLWVAQHIPAAYLRGVRQAQLALSEVGVSPGSVMIDPLINRRAIEVLVADVQQVFLELDQRLIAGLRTVVRQTQLRADLDRMVTERVAQGIAQGKARREVSREIADRLIAEYGHKPIRVGARRFSAEDYARMVARTKAAEAHSAGVVNTLVPNGEDLVMVSSHGATDGCGFYEGKVFSISGTNPKYPPLDALPNGGPPFHPNCIHALVPFVERLASGAERRRGANVRKEALGKSYAEVEKLARREAR